MVDGWGGRRDGVAGRKSFLQTRRRLPAVVREGRDEKRGCWFCVFDVCACDEVMAVCLMDGAPPE